jgi:hypothetical protein
MAPIETGELRGLVADAQPFNQNRGGGSSNNSSSSADDVPF